MSITTMRNRLLNSAAGIVVAALVSGCSLIPEYATPAAPIPGAWPDGPAYAGSGADGKADPSAPLWADVAWRDFFVDPALQGVIQAALDGNRDLRVAALNIEQARATYRVREADRLPGVNAGAGGSLSRTPGDLTSGAGGGGKDATITREYTANLGVTAFELDLFGRLRSQSEAARERFLATTQARDSVQISLIAEVANAYLTLLGDRELLALTEDTLRSREKSLDLIRRSFEQGVGTELDVAQARSSVETARASRQLYLRAVARDENALALLMGGPLPTDVPGTKTTLGRTRLVADLPVGLPSETLLRRPDIAQAEYTLKAANADIGAARAAFFPTISLTATLGTASPTLAGLFAAGSGAWSFAPNLSLPIFDGGANQANLDSAKAGRDIAVAEYEKAIQTAFREVADGLAGTGTLTAQLRAQNALVEATRTSLRLSQARYDRGIDSYLNVLDSQRSLFDAQRERVAIEVSRLSNLVTLYKALGGGRK